MVDIFSDRLAVGRLNKLEDALDHREDPQRHSQRHASGRRLLSHCRSSAGDFRIRRPNGALPTGSWTLWRAKIPRRLTRFAWREISARPIQRSRKATTARSLNREPFPVSGGYASRLFGESWESSNLYWARLADEKGYPPVMLNVLVPELTHRMVANISATRWTTGRPCSAPWKQTGNGVQAGKDYHRSKHVERIEKANGGTS